jgi:hypothetical protein
VGLVNWPNNRIRRGGIDQARPVGVIDVRWAELRFVQAEPAMAVDETAHWTSRMASSCRL